MIELRQLRENEWRQAMELKTACWTEELAGKAENVLSAEKQLAAWTDWMYKAVDNTDIRVMLGAFENGELIGVAAGSFAETSDISTAESGEKGVECNGLWVYKEHRGRGVSLMMLSYLLRYFESFGAQTMVVYSHHFAPSNTFYRKFGAKVIRQDTIETGGSEIVIDVFSLELAPYIEKIKKTLARYPNE